MQLTSERLVETRELFPGSLLPLAVTPAFPEIDLREWIWTHLTFVRSWLASHGGLLFRGFDIDGLRGFRKLMLSVSRGPLLDYQDGSSPRSVLEDKVFTSTDYPEEQSIFLHSELSYSHTWPMKLFFLCVTPAATRGETPLADTRRLYERIDPSIRRRFADKKVMYVRNFDPNIGMSWQKAFRTERCSEVEDFCRRAGIDFQWKEGDRLRTRQIGEAMYTHPLTRQRVWFNHVAFFHESALESSIHQALLSQLGREDLPNNCYYGDGTEIEDSVIDEIRAVYRELTVAFPWERSDFLMLDNMLTAHGRNPYSGLRKIAVGMSEPMDRERVEETGHD